MHAVLNPVHCRWKEIPRRALTNGFYQVIFIVSYLISQYPWFYNREWLQMFEAAYEKARLQLERSRKFKPPFAFDMEFGSGI
jgi:hypothetical protein